MKVRKRALIVDDERLARSDLRALLERHPEIQVVGEAGDVDEAVRQIIDLDPDVVFLDVQMPRKSGFDLLSEIETQAQIVFVTAYDAHAIRAFDINALDYLLKPVSPERLQRTIARILESETPAKAPAGERPLTLDDHLFVTSNKRARFLKVHTISCLRGADDYTEIVLATGETVLMRRSLNEWERRLPEKHFVRIHRTAIVHLEFVKHLESAGDDTFLVFVEGLVDGLPISRRHATRLKATMS
ncbi:response regulator [Pendulispora brunnea]|uniref:Response regulator n=1 Tax=Pendulispora brunnea TaxID=2905690 RepID=A0ABZ2KAJ4_9BACT